MYHIGEGPSPVDCAAATRGERTRKVRVYVVAPSYPPAPGGQEIHLQELSEGLMAAGVDVQVLTAAMEPPDADFIDTVPVIRLATFGPIQGGGWRSVPVIGLLLVRMFWRLVLSAR